MTYKLDRGYRIALFEVYQALDMILSSPKSHDDICELLKDAREKLDRVTDEITGDY